MPSLGCRQLVILRDVYDIDGKSISIIKYNLV